MISTDQLSQFETHDPTTAHAVFKGRPALYLSRAQAVLLRDPVPYAAYTIEADVATEGSSGYVGFILGARDPVNYEMVYVYPINAEGDGEVQYDACMNGSATWQVFHQPEYRRPGIKMAPGEWIHLRVVVRREQVEVYTGDCSEPDLVVSPLPFGRPVPRVGLWGFCPVYVSNFSVRPCDAAPAALPGIPPLPAGLVTGWEVSDRLTPDARWRPAPVEENGTLCFNRLYPVNTGHAVAFARTVVTADTEREASLLFGFSDKLRLLVNGEQVFAGETRWNPPHEDGRIRLGSHRARVRLKPGANEILAEVQCTEPPFGWGLTLGIGVDARITGE